MNCKSAAKKSVILIFALALALATILSLLFIETPDVAQAAVLKQGSRGDSVKTVQQKLIRWGYLKGSADGIFGAKTKAAVVAFQKKNGLTADGIIGTRTAQALGISLSGTTSSSSSSSASSTDLNLLARVVYGEARGEPYTGQVAVAAVVLNRVRSSSFPNSVAGGGVSIGRVRLRERRTNQFDAQSIRIQRRKRRTQRLGSDVRLLVLLQSAHGNEQMDAFAHGQTFDRQSRLLLKGEKI